MAHDEFQMEPLFELERLDDLLVPVARPALVHDLGFHHGEEILGFLVNDGEQVLFPFLEEGIVIADEQEHVLVGFERHLVGFRRVIFGPRVEARKRILARLRGFERALDLLLAAELANRQVAPALEIECVGAVENALDLFDPDRRILHVVPHAQCMGLEALDDQFSAVGLEGEIVFEEIVMTIDVRDRENLQQQRIVAHQVGDRGIGSDHHLVG